jgi:hypothetical protein
VALMQGRVEIGSRKEQRMVVQEREAAESPRVEGIQPLEEEKLQFLADRLRIDGYAVLEDAVPVEFIARLRERFDQLLDARIQADGPNRGANRYQMFLPWEPPFSEPTVYEHPWVLSVLERVLGQEFIMTYLASDTPMPGSDYQRVHSDTRILFPEAGLSLPTYAVVANFPLVDVTDENGPLEFWPGGTHWMPARMDLERLAPTMTSLRFQMRAGSILLRDARCWHRGTPNNGTRSRPHVALVYTRPWYRFEQRPIEIPRGAFEALPEKSQRMLRFNTILG